MRERDPGERRSGDAGRDPRNDDHADTGRRTRLCLFTTAAEDEVVATLEPQNILSPRFAKLVLQVDF